MDAVKMFYTKSSLLCSSLRVSLREEVNEKDTVCVAVNLRLTSANDGTNYALRSTISNLKFREIL